MQPIPGTRGMQIYPYIRKIDLMSSNSFILSGQDQIALIDPGALDDQLDCLVENIAIMLDEKRRPVVVYLTHVHQDHCFQLGRLRKIRALGEVYVAAQEIGAEALINQDPELTLAGLLGREMAATPVEIKLLNKMDILVGGAIELNLRSCKLSYYVDSVKIRYGPVLHSQTISLGCGDFLEVYPIPGHSPDSLCLRAGSLLFTGDLFFAPNPGMAGAYGWSRSALIKSIYKTIWIIEKKNILYCCSGHGRIIDADTAWNALQSMYQDVLSLRGLEEISQQWARNTATYAEDLMRELERLFTIIFGRLAYVSLVLEWLDEGVEAENIGKLIDAKRIDELFFDFNCFVEQLRLGKKRDWDLVHKAGQIIKNLEAIFEREELQSVLDRSLLRRAGRMLSDYAVTYRGFRPSFYANDENLYSVLHDVLDFSLSRPYEEDAILYADLHEDYLMALRARIAYVNRLEGVAVKLKADRSLPMVRMDRERFQDALLDLLERLSSSEAGETQIIATGDHGWACIRIEVPRADFYYSLDDGTMRFFERSFALCGGVIQRCCADGVQAIQIEFPPCDSLMIP
ncbi:MAG: MBL fold metallo-hydrolase [Methanothrix sp.]|nr:MBL fold metallo-hydrolase [Methanothrix sp.]